jgi:hypothetical protein
LNLRQAVKSSCSQPLPAAEWQYARHQQVPPPLLLVQLTRPGWGSRGTQVALLHHHRPARQQHRINTRIQQQEVKIESSRFYLTEVGMRSLGLNGRGLIVASICGRIKDVSTYDPQAYGPTPFSPRDSQGSCQSTEQGDYKHLTYLYSLFTQTLTMVKLEND